MVVESENFNGGAWLNEAGDVTSHAQTVVETFTPVSPTQLMYREESSAGTATDLHILTFGNETVSQPLIQSEFDEDYSMISPDSRYILYESNETGSTQILVRPFPNVEDGSWKVSRNGGNEPRWGPDGQGIYYELNDALMVVSVETEPTFSAGNSRVLIDGPYILANAGGTKDWHLGDHLKEAAGRAGLDLDEMEKAIEHPESHHEEVEQNQQALEECGHWGVPTFVFEKEPFFGQDRLDSLRWRLEQQRVPHRG